MLDCIKIHSPMKWKDLFLTLINPGQHIASTIGLIHKRWTQFCKPYYKVCSASILPDPLLWAITSRSNINSLHDIHLCPDDQTSHCPSDLLTLRSLLCSSSAPVATTSPTVLIVSRSSHILTLTIRPDTHWFTTFNKRYIDIKIQTFFY